MTKAELKNVLLKILLKYPWEKLKILGYTGDNIEDGMVYSCYTHFLQNNLSESVEARHIIRALQEILDDPEVLSAVRETISNIFQVMDPRDQNYRFRANCDCMTCARPAGALQKMLDRDNN